MIADQLVFFVEKLFVHLLKHHLIKVAILAVRDHVHHLGPTFRDIVGGLLRRLHLLLASCRDDIHVILEIVVLEGVVTLEIAVVLEALLIVVRIVIVVGVLVVIKEAIVILGIALRVLALVVWVSELAMIAHL